MINKMSNVCMKVLLQKINHIYKTGDEILQKEKKKNYKITFIFNDTGKNFKDILEQCFKEKMSNEKLLKESSANDLHNSKNGASICV